MSMLNWQWHTGLTLSEREPEVGSSQAEFNDGELVRPFTDLCPPLCPWPGPKKPEKAHGGTLAPPQGKQS